MLPLKLLLVLLSLQSLTFLPTAARPRCHPEERSALLGISTSVPAYWNASEDCCTWFGVDCDPTTSQVIGLYFYPHFDILASNSTLFSLRRLKSLTFKYGSGNLSDYLGNRTRISEAAFISLALNLTELTDLFLDRCDLSSVPPAMLTSLSSSLSVLWLVDCLLQGELPGEFFPFFPVLTTLDLSNNNLSGQIPLDYSNSKSLASLDLSNNNFHGPLHDLPLNLTVLKLGNNSIKGPIPPSVYALPYLEELYLSYNRFSGEIGDFNTSSLAKLGLAGNQLRGVIPKSLFRQANLIQVDLSSNGLTGTFDLGGISMLRKFNSQNLCPYFLQLFNLHRRTSMERFETKFNLKLNHLLSGEIPLSLCNLTSFDTLDLSHNIISGKIPPCMSNLTQITVLILGGNKLHGPVPAYVGSSAHYVDLSSNFLSGPCPIPMNTMYLFMSNNSFTGEISESVCYLETLETLDLSHNELSGRIPRCIGNITDYLETIDLQMNNFHGTIPMIFSRESELTSLHLNGNQFEGALPRSLENCTKLEVLNLGDNLLNDTFPNWLESLPKLHVLVLRANMFHGPIGNAVTKSPFPKMIIMDLSRNKFTGELPIKYFENFKAMQTGLRSANTSYVGQRHDWWFPEYQDTIIVSMKGSYFELLKIGILFTVIDFSSNNFTGEIPSIIGKLDSLKGLNLSHNSFRGSIPSSLGNLTNLEWLDLSSNQLVGHIPVELANLPWLSFLNLSHNRLTGSIPTGKQFNTFTNNAYIGNLALCGFPMSNTCGKSPSKDLKPNNDGDSSGLSIWKLVAMGFASGFVIGVSLGYVLLYSDGKPLDF